MDVIIIGAGASGLMAAITAANQGAKVTVIEHENKPGKKILVTGNGKCNITNTKMNEVEKKVAQSAASFLGSQMEI